jgi:hypothetical protein
MIFLFGLVAVAFGVNESFFCLMNFEAFFNSLMNSERNVLVAAPGWKKKLMEIG